MYHNSIDESMEFKEDYSLPQSPTRTTTKYARTAGPYEGFASSYLYSLFGTGEGCHKNKKAPPEGNEGAPEKSSSQEQFVSAAEVHKHT